MSSSRRRVELVVRVEAWFAIALLEEHAHIREGLSSPTIGGVKGDSYRQFVLIQWDPVTWCSVLILPTATMKQKDAAHTG